MDIDIVTILRAGEYRMSAQERRADWYYRAVMGGYLLLTGRVDPGRAYEAEQIAEGSPDDDESDLI